ncbi:V-type ATP synthase subunit D [Salinicola avicenniae]|uniref:V-type ATP synthase subunit D n=1 Tax=Salinicola avicenniae TaxID=2916836 RepID=UPI002073A606|nr:MULTISPECIES: V-type ATP synthase subunit D [unclassified Salinicola]
MYQRYLPALEMKQRMLLMLQKQAQTHLQALRDEKAAQQATIGEELSMLADEVPLPEAPLQITAVRVTQENLVGVNLPRLDAVEIEHRPIGLLNEAHWVRQLVEHAEATLRRRIAIQVLEQRLALLKAATRTVTQRVNLFSKVMIPTVERQIARIDLYLADQERASVVRAKLAKQKHAMARAQ